MTYEQAAIEAARLNEAQGVQWAEPVQGPTGRWFVQVSIDPAMIPANAMPSDEEEAWFREQLQTPEFWTDTVPKLAHVAYQEGE